MSCEHCGYGGECAVCGGSGADLGADIRALESLIADRRGQLRELERDLAGMRAAAGRRPGDGSDQRTLWANEKQPTLFGG